MKTPRHVLGLLLLLLSVSASAAYPDKAITVVVGFTAGGGSDILMRSIAPGLAKSLGQPVIVENRPGAGGNIAMSYIARARPDGYMLLFCSPALAINPTLYGNLTFSPSNFAPIGLIGSVDNVVTVNPRLPVHSIADLIAYARAHPGALNYASTGIGSSLHLATELFSQTAQVRMTHIPFKGANEALTSIVSGQVDVYFDVVPDALPQIKAGKIRALGVTGAQRSPLLPDVPTLQEAGLRDYTATTWNGLLAPAGTPAEVIEKVNAAIRFALDDPAIQQRFSTIGQHATPDTPAQFDSMIRDESAKWRSIIVKDNIRVQ